VEGANFNAKSEGFNIFPFPPFLADEKRYICIYV
jgi:hypothetical protein